MIIAMLLVRLAPGVWAMSSRSIRVVGVTESMLAGSARPSDNGGLIQGRDLQLKMKNRR